MQNGFDEFITAEMREIMASMDDASRTDPQQCCQRAMNWIEHNAADFRRQWDESHKLPLHG